MTAHTRLRALGAQVSSESIIRRSRLDPCLLEAITWAGPSDFMVELVCTEFTALCPKTSQPDFAQLEIKYIPSRLLVESKSLKLYILSFRNVGIFHEEAVATICRDLNSLLKPNLLEGRGKLASRGGVSINPVCRAFKKKYWPLAQARKVYD